MTRSFPDWLKSHACSTHELWLIQNCIGSLFGFDHWAAVEAKNAWLKAKEDSPSAK